MGYQFSSGLEVANFLVTSDPLHQSWDVLEKHKLDTANRNPEPVLYINETQESNCTMVTFVTANMALQGKAGLVSSSTLEANGFRHFEFLRNNNNPSFSLNQAAVDLFRFHYDELLRLKTKISKSTSLVIITGNSMGGCVATLFTLWLLESLNLSKTKRPLCITFGSPLIGDEQLRQCVLQFTTWNSCFLNVASIEDPVPKVFLSRNAGAVAQASVYKPLGTFLLCSASGCACFEDPDSILDLLVATNSQSAQVQDPNLGIQFFDYGQILKHLKLKAYCQDVFKSVEGDTVPLRAGIMTQLEAIGVLPAQQQPNLDVESLKRKMERHEQKLAIQKARVFNASKKLNDIKMYMAYMEWYKKESKRMNVGYYDMYKNKRNTSDINVEEYKKKLSNYWEDSVTEVENKPQKEGASFRTRWLMGGTNYRRMMEPLHIAEYYKDDGGKDYMTQKRPRHFFLLEKWLKEEEEKKEEERKKKGVPKAGPSKSKATNVASSLTDDSCFWARVEEALILCNLLNNDQTNSQDKESSRQKLKEFENYVLEALKNFAVSPDIFLKNSSFMKWWKEYKGHAGNSPLADVMKYRTYVEYENGVSVLR